MPAYGILYMLCFSYLENINQMGPDIHVIESKLDHYIPFCEYFVIPYMLWFIYISAPVIYFIFTDKSDYYHLVVFLAIGMTIFIIVSYVFPNGQSLRPTQFDRDNIFVDMVRMLYHTDTSTNILPSIHVFNSIGVHIAIARSKQLRKYKWVQIGSFILMILIILSTMFLKQHSIIDVISGIMLAVICYIVVYKIDYSKVKLLQRKKTKNHTVREQ